MAEPTTKIYHNTTDQPVLIKAIGTDPILPHSQVSKTTKYHQPVVLENYPGVVEITDMTHEEQEAFYAEERPKMNAAAAPRIEKLKQTDDRLNAAEAKAKGVDTPAPVPRYDDDGNVVVNNSDTKGE